MTTNPLVLWVIILIVAALIEAFSVQLLTIWFAIGAFAAIIADACSAPFYIQLLIFLAVSIILLIFTRPILKKLMKKNPGLENVNSEVGKTGTVTVEINPEKNSGRVLLGDINWNAVSKNAEIIPADSKVKVEAVDSTTLIVSKI